MTSPAAPVDQLVQSLKARLEAIDIERTRIVALLATYGENISAQPPIVHPLAATPVFPPIPETEKVVLRKDSNGRTGLSKVIVEVARRYPGLDMSQLADRVFDHITGDVPESRDSMRSMIKYQMDTRKLVRRDGRYYAADAKLEEGSLF